MRSADLHTCRQVIPNWGFETLRVMADTHHLVGDIERGLRYAAHLQGMEPRVGDKLQLVRDAVGVVQVSLSALERTAQQVLAEIADAPPSDRAAPGA
jgi:hypothetical protein